MQRQWGLLVLIPLLVAAGCGGSSKPIPVSGQILLENQPLADARVVFNPADSGGRMAFGVTDATGHFKLTTFNHGDGALPGSYRITVTIVGPQQEADAKIATNLDLMFKERERLSKLKIPKVHANYMTLERTPLKQDVPADGEIRLNLTNGGT